MELRQYLSIKIPEYMIPTKFISVDTFPITKNGKIDRQKLKSVEGNNFSSILHLGVQPINDIERTLCKIWSEILKIEHISVIDDFFKLGGHSLLLNRLVLRISGHYGVNLSVAECYAAPTIRAIAEMIMNKEHLIAHSN